MSNRDESVKAPDLAFCECKNKHIIGIVRDSKFYLTQFSKVQLLFPNGQNGRWDWYIEKDFLRAFTKQD